ncbi:hypothetical protein [Pectobacterium phage Wc4-1]|uniref:Uncharacterized protein n=1 Tax=Pectobacterium phage Wc4 TaxID=2652428 RepID=A0A5P8D6Y2_9CAUD|nr:hypothetical protein [Pectobacterium phage Wc4]QFP93915.1 hypothetical protein [Pectobacterium phage Wc4-1]
MHLCHMQCAPEEIRRAFQNVRHHVPEVTRVIFDEGCEWEFQDVHGSAPFFFDRDINRALIEEASDYVYENNLYPITYFC